MEASSSSSSSSSVPPLSPASEPGKLFVGGISFGTRKELLERYFRAFGEVREVVVIRDRTVRGKAFAFVQFADPAAAEAALWVEGHFIGGEKVDVRRAIRKGEHYQRPQYPNQNSNQGRGPNRNSTSNNNSDVESNKNHVENGNSMDIANNGCQNKIFVGGLPDTLTVEDFRKYFEKFGTVTDAVVIYENITRRPRGFGFIIFESAESFHTVLQNSFHDLNGKLVEVKIAVPKQNDHHDSGSHHNNSTSRNHSRRHNGYHGHHGAFYPTYPPQFSFYHDYAYPIYPPYFYGGYPMVAGGYRFPSSSSSVPWRGHAMAPLSYNVPYGNTAVYPGHMNGGYHSTTSTSTGGVVANSCERDLEEGEVGKYTTNGYSVVPNLRESNVGEDETGEQTSGNSSVVVNCSGNNREEDEAGKQANGEYIVVNDSCENNLEEGVMGKYTTCEYSVVPNSSESNIEEDETGKQTTGNNSVVVNCSENNEEDEAEKQTNGDYIIVTNSCENNLEEGDTGKPVTSVGGITTQC